MGSGLGLGSGVGAGVGVGFGLTGGVDDGRVVCDAVGHPEPFDIMRRHSHHAAHAEPQ